MIQIFEFGLEGDKFFHLSIFSCVVDNHKQVFCLFIYLFIFLSEMGGKTKTERVLEKENFELGKMRVGN